MLWLPLVLIPLVLFLVAYLKPFFERMTRMHVCAICVAVAVMWVVFLFLNDSILKLEIPIAILMGMSVVGVMYEMQDYFMRRKMKNFWFARLVIILGGFYSILFLLEREWVFFVLTLIVSVTLIYLLRFVKKEIQILQDCCD